MKTLKSCILIICTLCLFNACGDDTTPIEELDITGPWNLVQIFINGEDGDTYHSSLNTAAAMEIRDDYTYYRNYIAGTWSLDGSSLDFVPESYYGIPTWEYEVINVTETQLVVVIHTTMGVYGWGLDEFDQNEIVKILEIYERPNN